MGLVAPNVTDARLFCEGLGGWSMNEGKKQGGTLEEVYEARKVTGESEFWIKREGELQQLFVQ